jgi:cell division protein FtsA
MASSQIFAALEITQHEALLLIGEFFNSRINILKIDRVGLTGISGYHIDQPQVVVASIKQLIEHASGALGVKITGVLLCIPSLDVKRYSHKPVVEIEAGQRILLKDVHQALKQVMNKPIDRSLEVVNVVCNKFIVNGISSRKLPINEVGEVLAVEVDVLCADKEVTHALVGLVEQCGLQVLDISLDSFAAAKEMALFEKSVDDYVVEILVHEQMTSLALMAKGRYSSCESIKLGYDSWVHAVMQHFKIDYSVALRLCEHNLWFTEMDNNQLVWVVQEDPIRKITQGELNQVVMPKLQAWVSEIRKLCQPIVDSGPVTYYLGGELVDTVGFDAWLSGELGCEVKLFEPTTMGVRHSKFVSLLGMFYTYKDQSYLHESLNSVDVIEYNRLVQTLAHRSEKELTKKIIGIFAERM